MIAEIRIFRAAFEPAPDGSDYAHLVPQQQVAAPFSSGIVRVPPGTTTWQHNHQDTEIFVVLSGRARLAWTDGEDEVKAGDIVVLMPFTHHSVITDPYQDGMTFLTFWWTQPETYVSAAAGHARGLLTEGARDVHVLLHPPVASGDDAATRMALMADVAFRALRQQGANALRMPFCAQDRVTYAPSGGGGSEVESLLRALTDGGLLVPDGSPETEASAVRRLVFPLERHRTVLAQAADSMVMSASIKRMVAAMLARPLPDVLVAEDRGSDGLVACSPLTAVAGMMSQLRGVARGADDARVRPVLFFDDTRAFEYAVLMPMMIRCVAPELSCPLVLHAVDAKSRVQDASTALPAEAGRLHAVLTGARHSVLDDTPCGPSSTGALLAKWGRWLHDLFARIGQHHGGVVPEAGRWSARHLAAFAELDALVARAARAMQPEVLALQDYVETLDAVTTVAIRLSAAEPRAEGTETFDAETRTTLALELTAARQLAVLAAPLLPEAAAALGAALGLSGAPAETPWSDARMLLPSGIVVDRQHLAPWFDAVAI